MTEAVCIATRQLARMLVKDSENCQFHFENVDRFKEAVQGLPDGQCCSEVVDCGLNAFSKKPKMSVELRF